MTAIRKRVPEMSFPIRVETDTSPGWEWDSLTYDQVFKGKKVLIFSLPIFQSLIFKLLSKALSCSSFLSNSSFDLFKLTYLTKASLVKA